MYPWNSSFKDYYRLLQVHPEADPVVISASYYALIKKYHPDKPLGHNQYATLLNEAYEVLSCPQKRQDYHQEYIKIYGNSFQNSSGVLEKKEASSYLSSKNILIKQEEELKKREEELEKRELALKIKTKLVDEIAALSKNSLKNQEKLVLPQLLKQFDEASGKELKDIKEQILQLDSQKIFFIQEAFKKRLSLEQEAFLCEILLDCKDDKINSLLDPVFKFRQFYPKLFEIILDRNLKEYKQKIISVAKNTSFTLGNNLELLPLLLEAYQKFMNREETIEILVKIQVLLENKKITNKYKTPILIGFLMAMKDFDLKDYFKPLLKQIEKEEKDNSVVKTLLGALKG